MKQLYRIVVLALLWGLSLSASAAVNAWLNQNRIGPGDTVQLTLEHDGNTDASPDLAPRRQGFENCPRVAGPLRLGQRLRGYFGRERAAFALRDPDGELCAQACSRGMLVRRKHCEGALADPGDGAVRGRADAVDDKARLGEQVCSACDLGQVGRSRAAASAGLDGVGEELRLGQPDEQPGTLGVVNASLLAAADREFGVANRVVVGQRPSCFGIGPLGPELALSDRVQAAGASATFNDIIYAIDDDLSVSCSNAAGVMRPVLATAAAPPGNPADYAACL